MARGFVNGTPQGAHTRSQGGPTNVQTLVLVLLPVLVPVLNLSGSHLITKRRATIPSVYTGTVALSHTPSHSIAIALGRPFKARVPGSNPGRLTSFFSLFLTTPTLKPALPPRHSGFPTPRGFFHSPMRSRCGELTVHHLTEEPYCTGHHCGSEA